jgi:hypothetical protein
MAVVDDDAVFLEQPAHGTALGVLEGDVDLNGAGFHLDGGGVLRGEEPGSRQDK